MDLKSPKRVGMILEVATLDVRPGQEAAFETAFREAQAIIAGVDGYIAHELQRCIERSSRYLLLVRWETLEDHTVGFRGSPQYQEWKALLHHCSQYAQGRRPLVCRGLGNPAHQLRSAQPQRAARILHQWPS